MRRCAQRIPFVLLPLAILLIATHAMALDKQPNDSKSGAKGEPSSSAKKKARATPDYADIIPLAIKLTTRLNALKTRLEGEPSGAVTESKFEEIEKDLGSLTKRLQGIKDAKDYRHAQILDLKQAIEREIMLFEVLSIPLREEIGQLGALRKEWLKEKKQWSEWQSSLIKDGGFDLVKSVFARANQSIDTALDLIVSDLKRKLELQERLSVLQAEILSIGNETDKIAITSQSGVKLDASPPMFSGKFFSQFRRELWFETGEGLNSVLWPDRRFLIRQGWLVFITALLVMVLIVSFHRKKEAFGKSERWRFVAANPVSTALFLCGMPALIFYTYLGATSAWQLAISAIVALSFACILRTIVERPWQRHFIYGLLVLLLVTQFLELIDLPVPLFRLYVATSAATAFVACWWWSAKSYRNRDRGLYTWLLRLASFLFILVCIADVFGHRQPGEYLFLASLHSWATVIVFLFFMHLLRGFLEWVYHSAAVRRMPALYSDADTIIRRTALFTDSAMIILLVAAILMIWGVFDSFKEALDNLLTFGFNVGSHRITIGLLITLTAVLYGSYLVSSIVQKLFMDEAVFKGPIEKGVRHSLGRLFHYILMFVAFLVILGILGVELTQITIVLGALGVGIGFGLQAVVNNFMCGLILLFERPIRVGDTIEVAGNWSVIDRIGLRSTRVRTLDNADVIIPNANLVTNEVTNWTLGSRRVRLTIPVGVAYGSNVDLVMETLIACAKENPKVAKTPAPNSLFLGFGESTLNFELRVWLLDADQRLPVKSELHQSIDRSFRAANIEIAFPQRDLHLRSVDESVILKPSGTEN